MRKDFFKPDDRESLLKRMKAIAALMLFTALCGLALSHAMGGAGAWGWVRAFCEASVVGAIADWFAVVALFRHPLGLSIPHTAIIPRSKDRLADGLAKFVRDNFLDSQMILSKLAIFDPAHKLSEWLTDPVRRDFWVTKVQGQALALLETYDDKRLQIATLNFIAEYVYRWDAAPTVGNVLRLLTENGRHHELLDTGLQKLSEFLQEDEVKAQLSELMLKHARKEWPRIISTLEKVTKVSDLTDDLADKLGASLLTELRDVLAQPGHKVRIRYEIELNKFIQRLRADPELMASVNRLKERALTDPAVMSYVALMWADIKGMLREDLGRNDSVIARHIESGLGDIGGMISNDKSLRESINEHLLSAAANLAADLRVGVTSHISQTVKAWDDSQLIRELELSVGRDLQFIRINGTIVGGLIGLLLHALTMLN